MLIYIWEELLFFFFSGVISLYPPPHPQEILKTIQQAPWEISETGFTSYVLGNTRFFASYYVIPTFKRHEKHFSPADRLKLKIFVFPQEKTFRRRRKQFNNVFLKKKEDKKEGGKAKNVDILNIARSTFSFLKHQLNIAHLCSSWRVIHSRLLTARKIRSRYTALFTGYQSNTAGGGGRKKFSN